MLNSKQPRVRCRQIEKADLDTIANLLVRGFPTSKKHHWINALQRLDDHPTPEGFPKYGYMLESEGAAAGVLLLIYTAVYNGGLSSVRCNVSSWYVDPEFRNFAPVLVTRAMKHQPATYLNVSPSPHTWPIIEAQGFSRFCTGTFVAIPALVPKLGGAKFRKFDGSLHDTDRLSRYDFDLLRDHRNYGCLSLVCETRDGAYPLVLRRRNIKGHLLPAAQLIYCPAESALCHVAGPLGRYLLRRGIPLLLIGATGSLPLPGKYFRDKWPMYYQGSDRPWAGDMAYTETALFGV
jgi:hypothetical protein